MPIPKLEPLPPEEAIAFFRSKGLVESFSYQDVSAQEHAIAFTVAKATRRDVLQDLFEGVDRAISQGTTFDTFRKDLRPLLEGKGWWGRREMTDPLTGKARTVQLGSSRRLRTIFDVNLRQAYGAGRWERIEATKAAMPYLRYTAVGGKEGDGRTRPQHRAWHGTVLPVYDPWWQNHYPPCDFGCRCSAEQFNARTLERRGWKVDEAPPKFPPQSYVNPRTGEVSIVEQGISPSFNYNPGKARMDGLVAKAGRTPPGPAQLVSGGTPPIAPRPGPGLLAPIAGETPIGELARGRAAFLERFDLADGDKSEIFRDVGGEPLPIGPGLFKDASAKPVALPAGKAAQLPLVAEALIDPDEIRWVWGGAQKPLLTRRFIRRVATAAGVVDVAVDMAPAGSSPFWSWSTSLGGELALDALRGGVLAWRRAAGAVPAGASTLQPRKPAGSPHGGEFARKGGGLGATLGVGGGGAASLSVDEAAALSEYKNGNYNKINNHLRKGADADAGTKATIGQMDSALSRSSLPKEQTLYRGMQSSEVYKAAMDDPKSLIGKVLEDPGFMSTTSKIDIAAGFNATQGIVAGGKRGIVFEIAAPKGAKGMAIDFLGKKSKHTQTEGEVLFERGSRIKIVSIDRNTWRGNVVIRGRLI